MSIFKELFGNPLKPKSRKETARIEGVVRLFVLQVIQVMPGFVEKNLALIKEFALLPMTTNTAARISAELSIAAVAHSIALTPHPLVQRERQRYVTAHREAAQSVLEEQLGLSNVDSILRVYCEAHDAVMRTWDHPMKRMFTNQGFKIPMQHILEVFPAVAYDRLGLRHEDGSDPAYPQMKNPLVIEAWHKALSIVTNNFWEKAFKRYELA
jgi:hypothetical protein